MRDELGRVVVVRHDLLQLEVDEVVRVERAFQRSLGCGGCLWLCSRSGLEIIVCTESGEACCSQVESQVGGLLGWGGGRIAAGHRASLEIVCLVGAQKC